MKRLRRAAGHTGGVWLPLVVVTGVLLASREAHAQQNYRDVPIGGKTAVLGGVGTAAGNDSAMPYLNPAGLAGIPGDVFALSAQVYTTSRRKVSKFFAPNGYRQDLEPSGESFTSSNIASFPSSVMYMKHFGGNGGGMRMTAAFSLIVPTAQSFTMTGISRGNIPSENGGFASNRDLSFNAADYYIGPSWAVAINDKLRLGASVFGLYQTSRRTLSRSAFSFQFDGARTLESTESFTNEFKGSALVGILGAQATLVEGLHLGVGVALPSFRMRGNETILEQSNHRTTKVATKENSALKGEGYYDRPLRINAGLWFERPHSFGLGADVHLYAPRKEARGFSGVFQNAASRTDDVSRSYNEKDELYLDAQQVIDLSIGGEVWLSKMIALRGGFFTNRAPFKLDPTDPMSMEINRMGGTLGLGIQLGSFETTLGLLYQRGSGRMNVADETSEGALNSELVRLVATSISEDTLMFTLSAVVTTEEAQKTIKDKLDQVAPQLPGGSIVSMPEGGEGKEPPPSPPPAPPEQPAPENKP
jgi:hypothetical protein